MPYNTPSIETDSENTQPVEKTSRWSKLSKKQKTTIIAAASILVLIIIGGAIYGYAQQNKRCVDQCDAKPTEAPKGKSSPSPSPTATPAPLVEARLNGMMVEPGKENLHPLAVMIENHPEARPQSGLGQADLVYEAIAEGGITRFMAIYKDPTLPVRVGPVRSARTYYVDMATELNAFYAHVGGSNPALDQIATTGVLDLNQFSVGTAAFARDFSRKVATEHTMYSSTDKLWNYATGTKGWSKNGDFQPWKFKDDVAENIRPAAHTVDVSVSARQYDVTWTYDKGSNSYLRSMAGGIHKEANTDKQITAKNVILQTANKKSITPVGGKTVWEYQVTGSGPAVVIQNGTAIKATWKKEGKNRTRYYDAEGTEIAMVRGVTWTHLVHADSALKY